MKSKIISTLLLFCICLTGTQSTKASLDVLAVYNQLSRIGKPLVSTAISAGLPFLGTKIINPFGISLFIGGQFGLSIGKIINIFLCNTGQYLQIPEAKTQHDKINENAEYLGVIGGFCGSMILNFFVSRYIDNLLQIKILGLVDQENGQSIPRILTNLAPLIICYWYAWQKPPDNT